MNKFLSVIAALGAVSLAQAAAPTPGYTVTSDFTFASEYVFRGVEYADNSFQSSVEVARGSFNAGLWTNQPITRNQANEIDLYVGWSTALSTSLKLEAVGTYYWYPEATAGAIKDSLEVGVGATLTGRSFTPSLFLYRDIDLRTTTLQGSIGFSMPLEAIGASIDTAFTAAQVDASDSYSYWGIDVSIPYRLSTNATLTGGIHWSQTSNLAGTTGPGSFITDENFWFTVGVSIGF